MDPNNNEGTRLWRVFRTAHQMVHDRVMILVLLILKLSFWVLIIHSLIHQQLPQQ